VAHAVGSHYVVTRKETRRLAETPPGDSTVAPTTRFPDVVDGAFRLTEKGKPVARWGRKASGLPDEGGPVAEGGIIIQRTLRTLGLGFALAVILAGGGAEPASAGERPLFGFNDQLLYDTDGVTSEDKLEFAAMAGATTFRAGLDWRAMEPVQDVWSPHAWGRAEMVYGKALDLGIKPVFILLAAPWWARGEPCPAGKSCITPPARAMDDEWVEYAAEVARRFPDAAIEVWNEPNWTSFWYPRPDPERFAELQRLAYDAIKEVSPDTTVLSGGLANVQATSERGTAIAPFLRAAYEAPASIAGHLDGISIHMYGLEYGTGRGSVFERTYRQVMDIRRELDPARSPIWVTEIGISTGDTGRVSPQRQKKVLWRAWDELKDRRAVRAVQFHRLVESRESETSSDWGFGWLEYRSIDQRSALPTPRPVFCRFANRLGSGYPACP
jgi:polysaccharide biosynthesis protein PslG